MQHVNDILDHPKREIIEQRLRVIEFCDELGIEATRRDLGKSRSTIYIWKQKLKSSKGKLSILSPGDKTPLQKRKRIVHLFIEELNALNGAPMSWMNPPSLTGH